MSYARFSDSDLYVFASTDGYLECCGCVLHAPEVGRAFESTKAMVDHLADHRAAGHQIPDDIEDALWADDHDNFDITEPAATTLDRINAGLTRFTRASAGPDRAN